MQTNVNTSVQAKQDARDGNPQQWKIRIRNQHGQVIMEMPDIEAMNGTGLLVCPVLINGATVYLQGARNPLTAGCSEVVPVLERKK